MGSMFRNVYSHQVIAGQAKVHNGNNYTTNHGPVLLAEGVSLDIFDLTSKLSQTARQCEELTVALAAAAPPHQNLESLQTDVMTLQSLMQTLIIHLEDDDFSVGAGWQQPLRDLAENIHNYEHSLESINQELKNSVQRGGPQATRPTLSMQAASQYHSELSSLRLKLGVPIAMVQFCALQISNKAQAHHLAEVQSRLQQVLEQIENDKLANISPAPPHNGKDRAAIELDLDFTIRRYLAASSFSRDRDTIRAASMQLSSFGPTDSGSSISSYWTAATGNINKGNGIARFAKAQIFVRGLPGGSQMVLSVEPDLKIGWIKSEIRLRLRLHDIEFNLAYRGRRLWDEQTVTDSGIGPLSTLTCLSLRAHCSHPGPWFQPFSLLIVRSMAGHDHDYTPNFLTLCGSSHCEGEGTVKWLKEQIVLGQGFEVCQQRLIAAGKVLKDDQRLIVLMGTPTGKLIIYLVLRLPTIREDTSILEDGSKKLDDVVAPRIVRHPTTTMFVVNRPPPPVPQKGKSIRIQWALARQSIRHII